MNHFSHRSSILHRFSALGTSSDFPDQLNKRIYFSNICAAVFFLTCFTWMIIFLLYQIKKLVIAIAIIGLIYLTIPIANALKKIHLSRMLFFMNLLLSMSYFCFIDIYVTICYTFVPILIPIFFTTSEIRAIIAAACMTLANIILLHFFLVFPLNSIFYYPVILTSMTLVFISELVFAMRNTKVEEKLRRESLVVHDLIKVMSHDLRNFLFVAGTSTRKELQTAESEESKKNLKKIEKSLNLMNELITQVIEIEALRSGKLELNLQPVTLTKIFSDVHFVFDTRLKEKNISLHIDCSPNICIMGDPSSLLNCVFNNLISNAIKFSPEGHEIHIKAYQLPDSGVVVTVTDQGVGMPEEIMQNIFDPVKNRTREGTNQEKGIGFGMPLVKAFLDAHNSIISVANAPTGARGTIFKIEFPPAAWQIDIARAAFTTDPNF